MKKQSYFLGLVMALGLWICIDYCQPRFKVDHVDVKDKPAQVAPFLIVERHIEGNPENMIHIPKINRVDVLVEDAGLPPFYASKLYYAVEGNLTAQQWLKENAGVNWSFFSGLLPYRPGDEAIASADCYYNIGKMYDTGLDQAKVDQNLIKAYDWYSLAGLKGSYVGALAAGDMALEGRGIEKNEDLAYTWYQKALAIDSHGIAYYKLGQCYAYGIGTDQDYDMAKTYYFNSLADGYYKGGYSLLEDPSLSKKERLLLSKAVSSIDFSGSYFAMVYDGADGYRTRSDKQQVLDYLNDQWNQDQDPTVASLKASIGDHDFFDQETLDNFYRLAYNYGYHAYASDHIVNANQSWSDKHLVINPKEPVDDPEALVIEDEDLWNFAAYGYYQYDFDGDGQLELGGYSHSGAGGAFMWDGFIFLEADERGVYKTFNMGPDVSLRDGMRLVTFGSSYLLMANPYDDTANSQQNILLYGLDQSGHSHQVYIKGATYQLKPVLSKYHEDYKDGSYQDLWDQVGSQVQLALEANKNGKMFYAQEPVFIASDLVTGFGRTLASEDAYVIVDYDNDGSSEYVRKSRFIDQSKYYFDYHLFNIYDDLRMDDLDDLISPPDYYGIISEGSLMDHLPVKGKGVQAWFLDYEGQTYAVTLSKASMTYVSQVFLVKENRVSQVYETLWLDELQTIELEDIGSSYEESDVYEDN